MPASKPADSTAASRPRSGTDGAPAARSAERWIALSVTALMLVAAAVAIGGRDVPDAADGAGPDPSALAAVGAQTDGARGTDARRPPARDVFRFSTGSTPVAANAAPGARRGPRVAGSLAPWPTQREERVPTAGSGTPMHVGPLTDDLGRSPRSGRPTGGSAANGETREYVVQRGDSLWAIAKRECGDPGLVKEIVRLNRLPNADQVRLGQKLLLPAAGGMSR